MASRTRRWSYPRVNGIPRPRKRVSFKAERERLRHNANLLFRNLPQKKYIDYGPAKLQYHLGSIRASGVTRIRRVHRLHTTFSRWWYPSKHAVPFAHPFSRRSLGAKRYHQRHILRATLSLRSGLRGDTSGINSKITEYKFPGHIIPWRNFRFRRPRRGQTPSTLQRWAAKNFVGRTSAKSLGGSTLVVTRTLREIRTLERFFASHKA